MSTKSKLIKHEDGTFTIKNVRLSYPSLFRATAMEEGQVPKFKATFLLPADTHESEIAELNAIIEAKYKGELKVKKLGTDKLCFRDGDEHKNEEYHGHYYLTASDAKRPGVLDETNTPTAEEDDCVYAGCWVHARIGLWAQNNKWGQRINANLIGVKKYKDDEAFSGVSRPALDEMFADDDDVL